MRSYISRVVPVLGMALVSASAWSQGAPDAGSLLRESERQVRPLPEFKRPAPQPAAPALQSTERVRVTVQAFAFTGNTLLSTAELQAALAPWTGRELDFAELQQASNAVANAYRQRGWFARPQLPEQDVSNGTVTFHILESRLGEVRIDDGGKELRIERGLVRETMTARQQPGDPLNIEYLERSSNILNDIPGVAVATILAPGKGPGESDAVVKVADKPLLAGTAQLDNSGGRSSGDQKLTVGATLDNPSGQGDQAALNANLSQGSDYLKLAYSLPAGRDGLRTGISASALHYQLVGDDFQALHSKGDAQTWGLNASYPILRSGTRNLTIAVAYDHKIYNNEANQVSTSKKQIDAGLIALTGDALDNFGAGGMTLWGINYTAGDVDLSGNVTNAAIDQRGPQSAGSYQKLGANLARLQRLSDTITLWAAVNAQTASKNLDSSEKMSLGGPSGVRAYPVMEASGDEGWQATLEARYNATGTLQLIAFYDQGSIRRDIDARYTGALQPETAVLKGYGVGLNWSQPGSYSVRASVANRIGDNPLRSLVTGKDSDGSLDATRVWLTGTWYF